MNYNYFTVVFACIWTSNALDLNELRLPDKTVIYYTDDVTGKSITIPKSFADNLQSCHVIFPNKKTYEAFPTNRIPFGNIYFLTAPQPYTKCSIGFRGIAEDMSGVYELLSVVHHNADDKLSMTRLRVNLIVKKSEKERVEAKLKNKVG